MSEHTLGDGSKVQDVKESAESVIHQMLLWQAQLMQDQFGLRIRSVSFNWQMTMTGGVVTGVDVSMSSGSP